MAGKREVAARLHDYFLIFQLPPLVLLSVTVRMPAGQDLICGPSWLDHQFDRDVARGGCPTHVQLQGERGAGFGKGDEGVRLW